MQEKFKELQATAESSQQIGLGSSELPKANMEIHEDEMFLTVIGGKNKRRVYGLGNVALQYYPELSFSVSILPANAIGRKNKIFLTAISVKVQ